MRTMAVSQTSGPRPYDSPVRRQRAVETRERILRAGCRLLQQSSVRDWHALTIRGVADQAGVNERTVYRYFGNERGLRDAVMHRLEQQAGIHLEGMGVDDIADVAARIFDHVSSYPLRPKPPLDPTLTDANVRQRQALFGAIEPLTTGWSEPDRRAAAALLDVLWSVSTYERLASDWEMGHDEAVRTATWAIGLVRDALRNGQGPTSS
jgi:AcrR family transcriptional regulator